MKVVFCSAEVAPFSQAGGLGDVAGSLPRALARLSDLDVTICTPMYGMIDPVERQLEDTGLQFEVAHEGKRYAMRIWKGTLPRSTVPVYFFDNHELYGSRQQVYPYGRLDWELEGFLTFSQAVFELLRRLELRPDVLHVHDWHTAAVVTMLSELRQSGDPFFQDARSVLTIHNLNYQGVFGEHNWLKEGILAADAVTTVSPNYACEIQTPEFGAGLDEVMRAHTTKVSGILNGIDTDLYNPQKDVFIARQYDENSVQAGKAANKEAIQVELGLPKEPQVPLFGFVGRLAEQKGLDILVPVMERLKDEPVQFALLGTGDPGMEETLKGFNAIAPRIRAYIGFNTAMAQKIYAGSDAFVMPSRFEPCGLGQLISLRYGTLPVVRGVGGLVDTVFDLRENPEQGNGIVFHEYTADALEKAVRAAMGAYRDQALWQTVIARGMREDHSWGPSARAYQNLYGQLLGVTAGVAR